MGSSSSSRTFIYCASVLYFSCCLCCFLQLSTANKKTRNRQPVDSPPVIVKNPVEETYYRPGFPFTLECNATHAQEYSWMKDGAVIWKSHSGDLTYRSANDTMSGVYQCFAKNSYGTAVSTLARVTKAELLPFPTVTEPTEQTPLVGRPLTLWCNPPPCSPKGFVYWSEAGKDSKLKSIDSSARISLDYDGNLHFANVIMDDNRGGTKYVCTVSNSVFRSIVQGEDQIIKPQDVEGGPLPVPPQLMWSSPNGTTMVTVKSRALRMKCIFSGYPTPTVTWERILDNSDDSSGKSQMTFPSDSFGQEMLIASAATEDSGLYRCSANNAATGTPVSKVFTVLVESVPYWRNNESLKDVTVSEDENVFFYCCADGYPKPEVSWSLNGIPLKNLTVDVRRKVNATHLVFFNLTAADTQVVQCLAENKHGTILANAHLIVEAYPPKLEEFLDPEVKVAEGKDVTLNCSAIGAPSPEIRWSVNGMAIPESDDRLKIHPNGSLEIRNLSMTDDHVYKCSARNKFGMEEASGHLIVREKTQIVVPPKTVEAVAQSSVTLDCFVTTDPEERTNLVVQWLKDGNPVNFDAEAGRLIQTDRSLMIQNSLVSDTATYTCRASNDLDSAEYSAKVVIKDRPDSPMDLHLTTCNGSDTTLSWRPGSDNNDRITGYIVSYEDSLNESKTFNVSDIDSPKVVIALKPWRKYRFSVLAWNGLGSSDWSSYPAEACVTPPSTPFKNPEGVCSEMRGYRRLVIIWQPLRLDELNGGGFRYIVSYKRRNISEAREERLAITNWHSKELVIYDLEEFEPYEIYVQSVNDVGPCPGEVERRIAYSSEGTPIISPQNFRFNPDTLNSTSVEFQWDAIDERSEFIRGFFRGYQVQFWKAGQGDVKQTINVSIQIVHDLCPLVKDRRRREAETARRIVSAVATSLWPFTRIEAGVAVLNGIRAGSLSNTVSFRTLEGVPSPVTNLRMSEVGSFHIRLQWNAPVNPYGVIIGYVITYHIAPNESLQETFISDPLKMKAKLSPLQSDSVYSIYVYATTQMGRGEPAHLTVKTLSSGPPDKPFISLSGVGENYVNISWLPFIDSSVNPGSEFYVEYRKDVEHHDWQIATPAEEEERWANITDLEMGLEYAFAVVAVNILDQTKSDTIKVVAGEKTVLVPIVYNVASTGWFVAVMIIVALLILILIITLLICKNNKGGVYPVSKKEKDHGKAVTEEEKEFREYVRKPEANHVQSRSSLISEDPSEFSYGDDSLEEYEDPNTAKFDEDGSFIGQYIKKDSRNTSVSPSNVLKTFV